MGVCNDVTDAANECFVAEHKVNNLEGADRNAVGKHIGELKEAVKLALDCDELLCRADNYEYKSLEHLQALYQRRGSKVFAKFATSKSYPEDLIQALIAKGFDALDVDEDDKPDIRWQVALLVDRSKHLGDGLTSSQVQYIQQYFDELLSYRTFMTKAQMAAFLVKVGEEGFEDPFEVNIEDKVKFERLGLSVERYEEVKNGNNGASFVQLGALMHWPVFAQRLATSFYPEDLKFLNVEDLQSGVEVKFIEAMHTLFGDEVYFGELLRACLNYRIFDHRWFIGQSQLLKPDGSNWRDVVLLAKHVDDYFMYTTLSKPPYEAISQSNKKMLIDFLSRLEGKYPGRLDDKDKLKLLAHGYEALKKRDIAFVAFNRGVFKRLACGMAEVPDDVGLDFFTKRFDEVGYTAECIRDEIITNLPKDFEKPPVLSYEDYEVDTLSEKLRERLGESAISEVNSVLQSFSDQTYDKINSDLNGKLDGESVSVDVVKLFYRSGLRSIDEDFLMFGKAQGISFADIMLLSALGYNEDSLQIVSKRLLNENFTINIFIGFVKRHADLIIASGIDLVSALASLQWENYIQRLILDGRRIEDLMADGVDMDRVMNRAMKTVDYEDAFLRHLGLKHDTDKPPSIVEDDVEILDVVSIPNPVQELPPRIGALDVLRAFNLISYYNKLLEESPRMAEMFFDYAEHWARGECNIPSSWERLVLIHGFVHSPSAALLMLIDRVKIEDVRDLTVSLKQFQVDLMELPLGTWRALARQINRFSLRAIVDYFEQIADDEKKKDVLGRLLQSDMMPRLAVYSRGNLLEGIKAVLRLNDSFPVFDNVETLVDFYVEKMSRGDNLPEGFNERLQEMKNCTISRPISLEDEVRQEELTLEQLFSGRSEDEGSSEGEFTRPLIQALHPYFAEEFEEIRIELMLIFFTLSAGKYVRHFNSAYQFFYDGLEMGCSPKILMSYLTDALDEEDFGKLNEPNFKNLLRRTMEHVGVGLYDLFPDPRGEAESED